MRRRRLEPHLLTSGAPKTFLPEGGILKEELRKSLPLLTPVCLQTIGKVPQLEKYDGGMHNPNHNL